jgi:hypothetical protein
MRRRIERSAAYQKFLSPYLEERVSKEELDLYIAVVLRAVSLAREKYNVPTVILYLSYREDFFQFSGQSNEYVVDRFKRGGADVVDATLSAPNGAPLRIYDVDSPYLIKHDAHPTPLAHRERTKLLLEFLQHRYPAVLKD